MLCSHEYELRIWLSTLGLSMPCHSGYARIQVGKTQLPKGIQSIPTYAVQFPGRA